MDIESDLGIDSIKRVEILSALEEKMPHLPKVTPDMMGPLKTLGQICDYLSVSNQSISPAPAPAPETDSPSGAATAVSKIQQTLTGIVSELTGYPAEMLGAEMDIESDLGIDSIKRVEILSALEEKMPHLPKVTPDMMGTLKTIGQIIEYLGKEPRNTPSSEPESQQQAKIHVVQNPIEEKIDRQIIRIQSMPKPEPSPSSFPKDHFVGVVGGFNGLESELIQTFKNNGVQARYLKHVDELTSDVRMAGLILIAPMEAQEAFRWASACAPLLQHKAQHGSTFFTTISALDGAFGFSGRQIDDPSQGGLAGLAKTAAIEWSGVNCKALDIDPYWEDIPAVARAVCESILFADPETPIEVGIGPDGLICLKLDSVSAEENRTIQLSAKDVVIVTGGARGVTAAASKALASQTPCTLVLMGRSPAPEPEPQWLTNLSSEGDIKQAIWGQLTHQAQTSPKEIEHIYQKWMANRQVLATLSDLQRMGADAHYISIDVRDFDAIQAQLHHIRQEIGPIRGLIHGAGVLEDRFIVDKQIEQFRKVYDTKVKGLIALLNAAMEDDLKYMVVFSSVSARLGNQGQVDYAMANEVLNKTARQQAQIRPECKVIAINWGPWDGGMVTSSLKRNFLKNNIALIPIDLGAEAMVSEMAQPINEVVEVVIGGSLPKGDATPAVVEKPAISLALTCKRDINLDRYPFLHSHQLDGRPVVPLALITEWLAHSALHANPGLVLHGLDNLRMLNGIILDRQKRMIRMLAGKARRNGLMYEVEVEIRDGLEDSGGCVHSNANVILSEKLPKAPVFNENGHFKPGNASHCLDDIYKDVLFHGADLRGIKEIIRISRESISAKLASAPPPAQWINDPLRSRWIADPLVLDSAFQMAIVWCHQHYGLVSLPSFAAAYRQYCHRFPDTGVSAVLEIQKSNHRKMVGNFTFIDKDKSVLACIKGYEAIMDPGLRKAFKAA
jgi:NAD(P)-dependent dehydrogenase (short-subunit alcohol dehydrogenase family)/acyl carrier protein